MPREVGAPAKLRDVAHHAGVSMGTVSHVLNHPDKVSERTRERVLASISELGFVRDANASSLAAGRSRSIGLVVIDLANSMFVDVALGAQNVARNARRNLLLAGSQDDFTLQGENVDFFDEARVAGLLLAPLQDSAAQIRKVRSRGCPVVLINYDADSADVCSVIVDNEQAGYLAANHLMEQGCRRIMFVSGDDDSLQPVQHRRAGVRRALRERGTDVRFEEVRMPDLTERSGAEVGRRVAARGPGTRPDGVIGVTDTLAAGFIEGMVGSGIDVPNDIAVMGCDHNTAAASTPVTLTTIAMRGQRLGEEAMTLLLDEISGGGEHHLHQRIVVEPELIARGSTSRALSPSA
ncbi:LacI family DNA-binding transcriptional regulator [Microbacterium sp. KSW2-21]|uniref:LacI family DNA-binding transcriptional regulator n=1 Tax=Microbacterium algihabitans TaxID=3075992 RepID=A0ABU3RVA1_9MICO|nr:LacI family DNA-binding transcriptional regulator [Microbacterium sp. KSW2-21]MDU0326378.1 LacI family DNA-binding transcriptional regulator [Microbacterium sp. KSW2-21]